MALTYLASIPGLVSARCSAALRIKLSRLQLLPTATPLKPTSQGLDLPVLRHVVEAARLSELATASRTQAKPLYQTAWDGGAISSRLSSWLSPIPVPQIIVLSIHHPPSQEPRRQQIETTDRASYITGNDLMASSASDPLYAARNAFHLGAPQTRISRVGDPRSTCLLNHSIAVLALALVVRRENHVPRVPIPHSSAKLQ